MDGFDDLVKEAAIEFVVNPSWSKFVVFKNKLKFIKGRIRAWNADSKAVSQASSSQIFSRLVDIDKAIDDGNSCDEIVRE